jgi:DNA-binding NarL/FixJ family response regulator
MTGVLLINGQQIVLSGCRRVIEDAGVDIVVDACDLESGYRLYLQHRPDVVVIDLSMHLPSPRIEAQRDQSARADPAGRRITA